jgi:hypothetical protein
MLRGSRAGADHIEPWQRLARLAGSRRDGSAASVGSKYTSTRTFRYHYVPARVPCTCVMQPCRQLRSCQCNAPAHIMGLRSMNLYRVLQGCGHAVLIYMKCAGHTIIFILHHHTTNTTGSGSAEDEVLVTAPAPPAANYVPSSAPAAPARVFEKNGLISGMTTVVQMRTQRWGEAQDRGAAADAWVVLGYRYRTGPGQ